MTGVSVRTHALSLGAVLLALSLGVVAGAAGARDTRSSAGSPLPTVPSGVTTAAAHTQPAGDGRAAQADAVLDAALPAVVAGTLDGVAVAVLSLGPSAVPDAARTVEDLTVAGATITAAATLAPLWVDPASQSLRTGLAGQAGIDAALPAALATSLSGDTPARQRATTWGALSGAGLLVPPADAASAPAPGSAADVVVVVTPPTVEPGLVPAWTEVLSQLSVAGPVLVTAASTPPADAGGSLVLAVRPALAGRVVSTVDDAGSGLGRVATVRATADLRDGVSGHYGSADGAVSGVPAARPSVATTD